MLEDTSNKPSLHIFSRADMTKGHGVLSAYDEQVKLLKKFIAKDYDIRINPFSMGDLNHFHTINLGYYLKNKFFGRKKTSIAYVHFLPETMDDSIRLPRLIRKIFYKYIISFYKSMDYTVVVNPHFIKDMEKYGIDTGKTTYIPNLVSNENFYKMPEDERQELRKARGFDKDDFIVLGVGQLQTRKGIFDFVQIAGERPDMKFLWAGGFTNGPIQDGYDEIRKLKKNPPKNMSFLGMVDRYEMNELYNIADVMFLPSYAELFPMTVLEAMAANMPILLRDIDIYRLILDGYYLKAVDNKGFMDRLDKLKEDADYREKASTMAKKGNDFYSEESVAKQWMNYYESLLKNIK